MLRRSGLTSTNLGFASRDYHARCRRDDWVLLHAHFARSAAGKERLTEFEPDQRAGDLEAAIDIEEDRIPSSSEQPPVAHWVAPIQNTSDRTSRGLSALADGWRLLFLRKH